MITCRRNPTPLAVVLLTLTSSASAIGPASELAARAAPSSAADQAAPPSSAGQAPLVIAGVDVALAAATIRPAEFLGLEGRFGTIEAGRHADLVLLAANPLEDIAHTREIEAVVYRGRLYDRAELDAMLESAATTLAAMGGP